MNRKLVVLAVITCVALAGCSGVFGTRGDGPTEEPTETVDLSAVEYPDHAGPDGIEDWDFAEAMHAELADEGYTANYTTVVRRNGGELGWGMDGQIDVNRDATRMHVRYTFPDDTSSDGRSSRQESYVDGQTKYIYDSDWEPPEGVSSASPEWTGDDAVNPITELGAFGLQLVELEASHGIERGETTLIVYDVTAYHYVDDTTYTNVSGQAVIDERGVLRELTYSFPKPTAENTKRVAYTISTETPTIEEPDWISEVNSSTTDS